MAVVYIPSWLLCWITIKQGTETYHFDYSYQNVTGAHPTDADLLLIATDVFNRASTGLQPILNTTCQIVSCTVRDMGDNTGHEATYAPTSNVFGTSSGDPEPANVAATMSYSPAAVGKGVRGRTFISGLADTTVVNQVLTSALQAALVTLAASLRTYTGLFSASLVASIASRKHELLRKILSSTVTNQVNSQIRRLIGHRRHKRRSATP